MDNETEPLILEHVMLSFLIFFAGLGLGVVAFIFELGYFKCMLDLNRAKKQIGKKSQKGRHNLQGRAKKGS